jgi:hypothetical protein
MFPGLTKKTNAHFWIILRVVSCKNHVAKPLDSFNRCSNFLLSSQETFFCRNWKKDRLSFLGRCNVETASLAGWHLGPLLLKSPGVWGWFYPKNFSRATFLVFWVTQLVDMFLSYLPVKQIWRKSAVWVSPLSMLSIIQPIFLQKPKPLYPHPKYLFGIGIWIWIWSAKNLGFSLHVSVVRV